MDEKDISDLKLRFPRRAVLKMALAAPVAGLSPAASLAAKMAGPVPLQSGAGDSDAAASTGGQARKTFTPQEWNVVRAVCDRILPADDNSGSACDAGVPEFLDDWLDFQRGDLLTEIRFGLAWLDATCRQQFQHGFAGCSPQEQSQVLDRIAWPEKAAPEDMRAAAFFARLRALVLDGYFTSEIGIRDLPYLGNEPQSAWDGCPSPVLDHLGLA
jgi:hypothetical protein